MHDELEAESEDGRQSGEEKKETEEGRESQSQRIMAALSYRATVGDGEGQLWTSGVVERRRLLLV